MTWSLLTQLDNNGGDECRRTPAYEALHTDINDLMREYGERGTR